MSQVQFLTFNTWGLKYISKNREERLNAIAEKIAREHTLYDVIALQEIWCQRDWDTIVARCSKHFPYHRWFSSGIIAGPGLAILSKIPIESTFLYRFPINGRPSAFFRGDWYVGKSIAISVLANGMVIMNSHMHAPYALTGDAAYECHRACQAWDFSRIAQLYTKAGYSVVIVGDLNSRPGSLPHKFLTVETGLVDSWEQLYGTQDLQHIAQLSAEKQIEVGGTTCDSLLNTWRADRLPTEACRLDYALIDPKKLKCVAAEVRFTEQIPGIGSYSDHFAYSCTLEFTDNATKSVSEKQLLADRLAIYNDMLHTLENYKHTALMQKSVRGWHFVLSVVILIGIHVVTTFTAALAGWSSVMWVFGATFVSVTGLVDGLISFLFGRKELKALREVYLEVQDSKRNVNYQLQNL